MIKTVETLGWLSRINIPFHPESSHLREPTVMSKAILNRNGFLKV